MQWVCTLHDFDFGEYNMAKKKKNPYQQRNRNVRPEPPRIKQLKPVIAVSLASFGLHMAAACIVLENDMQAGVLIGCLTPLLAWGAVTERRKNRLTLGTALGSICIGSILPGIYLVGKQLWWGVGCFAEAALLFGTLALIWKNLKK